MNEARQQDIVWVRFPYSDLREAKFRPAAVVSNDRYNRKNLDVVVCAVTSRLDDKEYSVLIDETSLDSGKMPLKSRVRADKIIPVGKKLIEKPFARLNDKTFDLLVEEINKLIKKSK